TDMIDTTLKVQSGVLDAVTGATNPTFASVTVEGAMYTVYTLWRFVNGTVRQQIRQHTKAQLTHALMAEMLPADRLVYQLFVYEHFTDRQRRQFAPLVLSLIGDDDPYIPHFAIDQLTPELLADSALQVQAMAYLATVAAPVQNSLLSKMRGLSLHSESVRLLLETVPAFSANQMANVFAILEDNIPSIKGEALQTLTELASDKQKQYGPFVAKLLQRLPKSVSVY